jgi:hypothetical protein
MLALLMLFADNARQFLGVYSKSSPSLEDGVLRSFIEALTPRTPLSCAADRRR